MTSTVNFYQDFNVQGIRSVQDGQFVADCPACGKQQHFYFNNDGQYDCKVCHQSGNHITFLRNFHGKTDVEIHGILKSYGLSRDNGHRQYEKTPKAPDFRKLFEECQALIKKQPEKLLELARIRGFANESRAVELMKKYQICVDAFGNFVIPFFNFENNLIGLQRYHPHGVIMSRTDSKNNHYVKDGEPVKSMFLKGCKVGLWGYQQDALDSPEMTIIVCEAPFKALHMQIQGFDGKTDLGVFGKNVLAVGIGGAGNLPKGQIFKNRNVEFLYDFDEAGQRGILADAKKIAGVAKSVYRIGKHLTRHEHLLQKFGKVDLTDDYFCAGGTLKEFLQDREEYREQISIAKTPAISQDGNDLAVKNLTDLGNAKRLVARHGDKIRFSFAWKKWFFWDGKTWSTDVNGQILRLAKDTVKHIYEEAAKITDIFQRQAAARWAVSSESERRLNAMVALAQSEPDIPISPQELDTNPDLLNCFNGTVDLKTGKLKPHDPKDFITKIIPVKYQPEAVCPLWLEFLETIFDWNYDLIGFLQRAAGYSLTGDTSEQCLFLLHGYGANGKSTFLNIINHLLGDYAQTADFETFLIKKNETVRNDLARMIGRRFISAIEVEGERRLSEVLVKQLTGGDTIAARFLFGEYFDFRPTFKIWLAANHKPNIRGTDHAIWRRIRLVPFIVTIPEDERDSKLFEKLQDELPGILSWAVQGCLEWQRVGLKIPDEVRSATNEYRSDMDSLGAFLSDCCLVSPEVKVRSGDLYEAYRRWCEDNGEHSINNRHFGRRLSEKSFQRLQSNGNWWRGVGIKVR